MSQVIERWTDLHRLERVRAPQRRCWFGRRFVATDVQNPLLGPRGASRVYGPQKGLRAQDFALAERCLGRLALVVRRQFKRDFARMPGAGAAGGLGFGLMAFMGAELKPGFELVEHVGIEPLRQQHGGIDLPGLAIRRRLVENAVERMQMLLERGDGRLVHRDLHSLETPLLAPSALREPRRRSAGVRCGSRPEGALCLLHVADQIQLADIEPVMSQDGVSRRRVEVEVGQREVHQVRLTFE